MLPAAADSIFWCLVPAKREEVLPALDTAKANGAQAVNLLASPLFSVEPRAFIERIVALRLPAMHQWPEIAEDGGLLGYGPRFTQVFRQRQDGSQNSARSQTD